MTRSYYLDSFTGARDVLLSYLRALRALLLLVIGLSSIPAIIVFFTRFGPVYPGDRVLTIGSAVLGLGIASLWCYVAAAGAARAKLRTVTTRCGAGGMFAIIVFALSLLFYIDGGGAENQDIRGWTYSREYTTVRDAAAKEGRVITCAAITRVPGTMRALCGDR